MFDNTMEMQFNPEELGFRKYVPPRGSAAPRKTASYYLFTSGDEKKDGRGRLKLAFSQSDANLIAENIGEYVAVYVGDEGNIILTRGDTHALGRSSSNGRRDIACSGLISEILGEFGEFRRLYVDVSALKRNAAVLIKPNGKRD